jgi:hypothetical protein
VKRHGQKEEEYVITAELPRDLLKRDVQTLEVSWVDAHQRGSRSPSERRSPRAFRPAGFFASSLSAAQLACLRRSASSSLTGALWLGSMLKLAVPLVTLRRSDV